MKTQMESLIHHFKIVTEGFAVPAGQVYQAIESPRGEMGYFVVSDGTAKPYRVHMRNPTFASLQALETMCVGPSAGRCGRRDRLHRYRAGRNRPVSDRRSSLSGVRCGSKFGSRWSVCCAFMPTRPASMARNTR